MKHKPNNLKWIAAIIFLIIVHCFHFKSFIPKLWTYFWLILVLGTINELKGPQAWDILEIFFAYIKTL